MTNSRFYTIKFMLPLTALAVIAFACDPDIDNDFDLETAGGGNDLGNFPKSDKDLKPGHGPHAAPIDQAGPSNDEWENATVVTALSYQDTIDVSEATTGLHDPYCEGDQRTVWYRYTPETDVRIVATAWGDYYDTSLSVYTEPPRDNTQLFCNDNYTGGLGARVIFDASAGTTYYFMVADTGNRPATDWELTFAVGVSPPAPTIDDTIDSVTFDPNTGQIVISGTTTCTNGVSAAMYLHLRQKQGKTVLEDDAGLDFACEADMPWNVVFESEDQGPFTDRKAALTGWAMACNCQIGECDSDEDECAVIDIDMKLKLESK